MMAPPDLPLGGAMALMAPPCDRHCLEKIFRGLRGPLRALREGPWPPWVRHCQCRCTVNRTNMTSNKIPSGKWHLDVEVWYIGSACLVAMATSLPAT